jgi:hypothetical protein
MAARNHSRESFNLCRPPALDLTAIPQSSKTLMERESILDWDSEEGLTPEAELALLKQAHARLTPVSPLGSKEEAKPQGVRFGPAMWFDPSAQGAASKPSICDRF